MSTPTDAPKAEQQAKIASMLGAGCPVIHKKDTAATPAAAGVQEKAAVPAQQTLAATAGASDCATETVNPSNNMLVQERQQPAPNQAKPLSTDRQVSSIPRSDFVPAHQSTEGDKWQYPSEQMFYNAMLRKGWNANEDDMPLVVAIHNAVNEMSWQKVLEWEKMHPETYETVKLKKFVGRPKDLTPKARFRNWFQGYSLPFDRHDWIVERGGEEVRYVVDFYNAKPTDGKPIGMFIDARPALDSVTSVVDRIRMAVRELLK